MSAGRRSEPADSGDIRKRICKRSLFQDKVFGMVNAKDLEARFFESYPEAGDAMICRAPGRINLIGEHTDYNGLPVLPMTIDKYVWIVFAPREDGRIHLCNADRAFAPREFANVPDIAPSPPGSWENYCKAAVQGLNHYFGTKAFPGMDMYVAGSIPIAAGLSSSSALVVASALAYLRVLGKSLGRDMSRLALATLLADAEHYVGTRGGGMDQAAILLGKQDMALKIDFFPLRLQEVPLPDGHEIVCCNSLVQARKTGEVLHRYNEGPRLCRLICALVELQAQKDFGEEVKLSRLGDLWHGHLCLTDDEATDLFDRAIPNGGTTIAEAADMLGTTPEDIRGRWLGDLHEPPGGFPLRARARHQLTEYQRVEMARDAMLANDAQELGRLMNDSHSSCARDYQISCRELDYLVTTAREAGASGSRLSGAGFGGSTVNLVPAEILEDFCDAIDKGYYREYMALEKTAEDGAAPCFAVRAAPAADYLVL